MAGKHGGTLTAVSRRPSLVVPGQPDLFSFVDASGAPEQVSRAAPIVRRAAPERVSASKPTIKAAALVLRVHEAAERIGLSVSTLNKMRCDGRGPRFIKLTGKTIGYMTEDLDAWVAERRALSE